MVSGGGLQGGLDVVLATIPYGEVRVACCIDIIYDRLQVGVVYSSPPPPLTG